MISIRATLRLSTSAFVLTLLTGCLGMRWSACERAWDDFRCDRRIAVFVNLRLDTDGTGGAISDSSTSVQSFNRSLAYFYGRNVSEVIFEGRTTAHGTLAEFRALNAGFSSIPDPAYKRGHATVTWNVARTYRFAPEDTRGKYHPSTFWPRLFGTAWSDDFVGRDQPSALQLQLADSDSSDAPRLFVLNYYGTRCHIQEVAYVKHVDEKNFSKKVTYSWDIIRAWDLGAVSGKGSATVNFG